MGTLVKSGSLADSLACGIDSRSRHSISHFHHTHGTACRDHDSVQRYTLHGCWTYPLYMYVRWLPVCMQLSVITDLQLQWCECSMLHWPLLRQGVHRQVGMGSPVTSGSLSGVMVRTMALHAIYIDSICLRHNISHFHHTQGTKIPFVPLCFIKITSKWKDDSTLHMNHSICIWRNLILAIEKSRNLVSP